MSAHLRVDAVALRALDAHITLLPWARLVRAGSQLGLECAEESLADSIVLLARAGARGTSVDVDIAAPASGLVPAVVPDLAPRDVPGIIDRISVRPIDAGEATVCLRSAERRRFFWRRRDRAPLRALLRGEERVFAWRRIVWARPAVLRSSALRGARPVIFDRDALERSAERQSFVGADELTRWARG